MVAKSSFSRTNNVAKNNYLSWYNKQTVKDNNCMLHSFVSLEEKKSWVPFIFCAPWNELVSSIQMIQGDLHFNKHKSNQVLDIVPLI